MEPCFLARVCFLNIGFVDARHANGPWLMNTEAASWQHRDSRDLGVKEPGTIGYLEVWMEEGVCPQHVLCQLNMACEAVAPYQAKRCSGDSHVALIAVKVKLHTRHHSCQQHHLDTSIFSL